MRLDFGQPDDDDDPLPEPLPSPPPPEETGALSTWTVPPTAPANVRVAEAAALAAWIEQAGGSAAGVAPAPAIDDGVGLVATNGARRGDVLLAVPLSLGLSAESALRSSIGAYLAEFEPYLADYAFIALALLHERRLGEESALAPWLLGCPSLLPPSGFADLPLLWGDEGLASLAAATTAGATERMSDVRADFEWLQANVFATAPDVFPPSAFSFAAYAAAVATALSRAQPVAADGDEYDARPVLLPLLDLVNHELIRPAAAIGYAAAKKAGPFGGAAAPACVTLVASAPTVDAGGALSVRYGGSTAGELLLDYGFLSEPVAAVAPLTFAVDEDDILIDEKCDVLELNGLTEEATWLVAEEGETVPGELMAFLRVKHLSGADAFLLEPVFIDSLWQEHAQLPVSEANERAALTDVGQRCEDAVQAFGGSLRSDLQTP